MKKCTNDLVPRQLHSTQIVAFDPKLNVLRYVRHCPAMDWSGKGGQREPLLRNLSQADISDPQWRVKVIKHESEIGAGAAASRLTLCNFSAHAGGEYDPSWRYGREPGDWESEAIAPAKKNEKTSNGAGLLK